MLGLGIGVVVVDVSSKILDCLEPNTKVSLKNLKNKTILPFSWLLGVFTVVDHNMYSCGSLPLKQKISPHVVRNKLPKTRVFIYSRGSGPAGP